ncbi:acyl-CoA dehydrogenase, C-terminal domain protein [Collimonas arenae]|uniref:Acyl-coenzyme A dehydrogenase n=1 Tax=Collimonas arenae TaxID=279058 RepID=A0A127PUT8_9BURK|nr:acyl-CoA dehydrogenase [Collimonas arenae]AMP01132.1 acyl-CoA dehydrogenase, C-terminal domain protein [Collimonas arenae]AMP11027.1 acyl-CoA dehydrogenase, C-terminal domain protein [Collimonas arenae]
MFYWIVALFIGAMTLMQLRVNAWLWLVAVLAWIGTGFQFAGIGALAAILLLLLLVPPTLIVAIKPLRYALLSRPALKVFQRILPRMSQTERDAIEAGTIWWDAELFSGKPAWEKLLQLPAPKLSAEEQDFFDNEVEQLCRLVSDWETTEIWQDLSPQAWQFVKDKGFLGMIIPKQYGGKGFSAYMHSQVIMKLSSHCSAAAISVMVPNSLGPAELLLQYGTEEQKDYFLPRLAAGQEIPCFALTSPYAGSDAAAIPDVGVVCMGSYDGQEMLGFRLTWDKRYITLGPVATVLGLAFRVQDPERLLVADGNAEIDLGITCALIPTNHPGVVTGRRHWPLNAVFQNGPTSGKDVFIPLDWVIGGREQIGKGWRMLMECLAAGRAISLPSSTVGFSKLAVQGTSAYAAMRQQFKIPIGKFEGIHEMLARMGGNLYLMDAVRRLSALAVDAGEKPSVISAISKYHVTERGRVLINAGMDVLGGKGICMGPNNFMARSYQQMPIAITVEGANILTRCLIIFGQGAIRCHPYVLKEMAAAGEADQGKALHDFDQALFGHISFVCANFSRTLLAGLSSGSLPSAPRAAPPELRHFYRAVNRMSAAFALLSDMSMFVLGGSLKFRERISGRLGDILSQLYLVSSVLKRYEDDGRPTEDLPYVHWAIQDALHQAQEAYLGVLENFPNRPLALLLRVVAFPFGRPYQLPSDALDSTVARNMQTNGESRDRLIAGMHMSVAGESPHAAGELAFQLILQVNAIEARLKPAIQAGTLAPIPQSLIDMQHWIVAAAASGDISEDEQQLLQDFARHGDSSVQVDDFPQDFNLLESIQKRMQALQQA